MYIKNYIQKYKKLCALLFSPYTVNLPAKSRHFSRLSSHPRANFTERTSLQGILRIFDNKIVHPTNRPWQLHRKIWQRIPGLRRLSERFRRFPTEVSSRDVSAISGINFKLRPTGLSLSYRLLSTQCQTKSQIDYHVSLKNSWDNATHWIFISAV